MESDLYLCFPMCYFTKNRVSPNHTTFLTQRHLHSVLNNTSNIALLFSLLQMLIVVTIQIATDLNKYKTIPVAPVLTIAATRDLCNIIGIENT